MTRDPPSLIAGERRELGIYRRLRPFAIGCHSPADRLDLAQTALLRGSFDRDQGSQRILCYSKIISHFDVEEPVMKVKLAVIKAGRCLHDGAYEIDDAASFSAAFADLWVKMRERSMTKATSIGDLMDSMQESVIDELNGAEIRLQKL
jgi:hypothetical protein